MEFFRLRMDQHVEEINEIYIYDIVLTNVQAMYILGWADF